MGAAVSGVLIGGTAVSLGVQQRPATVSVVPSDPRGAHEPVARTGEPMARVAEPSLADVIEATRASVVDLETPRGVGAGVIVDPSGIVVTHAYLIGDARLGARVQVQARLWDDRRVPARVSVVYALDDLAVLVLEATPGETYTAARIGSSDAMRVGDEVFAFGNPLRLGHSVTRGIVAARDRVDVLRNPHTPALQLDLSVHLGHAGGPLFNRMGELVGIVTMGRATAGGIAFAVPIDHVRGFLEAVGDPEGARASSLGIELDLGARIDASVRGLGYGAGLRIGAVREGEPAQAAGLRAGDVIVALRGKRLDGVAGHEHPGMLAGHLRSTVQSMFAGERLRITVVRAGGIHEVELVI